VPASYDQIETLRREGGYKGENSEAGMRHVWEVMPTDAVGEPIAPSPPLCQTWSQIVGTGSWGHGRESECHDHHGSSLPHGGVSGIVLSCMCSGPLVKRVICSN
jgi:hypothetical protein